MLTVRLTSGRSPASGGRDVVLGFRRADLRKLRAVGGSGRYFAAYSPGGL